MVARARGMKQQQNEDDDTQDRENDDENEKMSTETAIVEDVPKQIVEKKVYKILT